VGVFENEIQHHQCIVSQARQWFANLG